MKRWDKQDFTRLIGHRQVTGFPSPESLRRLCDTAIMANADPKSVQVNVTTGTGMEIEWKDGHHSSYKFQYLRDSCPCALCKEQRSKSEESGTPKAAVLPMFREPARPREVKPVGKYAISFVWNDGHQHGIYSWEFLRGMCPCAECSPSAARAEEKQSSGNHSH